MSEETINIVEKPEESVYSFKQFAPIFILVGIILLIASITLAFYYEVYTPSKFCKLDLKKHEVVFFPIPPQHYCNGSQIELYSTGWKYKLKEVDFSLE